MATNGQFGVGILLTGQDRVSPAARKAGRSMLTLSQRVMASGKQIKQGMKLAQGGLTLMTHSFKGLKGTFGLAKEAGKFTQEMAAVQAIMNVNVKTLKTLENAAIKAGLATQFSPLEGAQALRALGQAGNNAKASMDILRPSLDLAAASLGKLSPTRAGGAVNAALKVFGMRSWQARKAVDALVFSTNRFNITVEQLPIGVGNMARGAIALKQGMNDSMIALGLVKNVLPEISTAATLTSSTMLRIADPTVQKKLSQLGVKIKDAKGNFLPFITIVHNLNTQLGKKFKTNAERAAAAVKILGRRGIVPYSIISKQLKTGIPVQRKYTEGMKGITKDMVKGNRVFLKGAMAIKFLQLQFKAAQGNVKELKKLGAPIGLIKFAKDMKAQGGASNKFVQTLLNTFTGQLTLMKGAFQSFLIAIGKPLTKVFRPFVSAAFKFFSALTKWVFKLPAPLKKAIASIVVFGLVMLGVVGAFAALKAIALIVLPAILTLIAPILIAGLKIAAVAGLIWAAWNSNFLGIRDIIILVGRGFMETFGPMWKTTLPILKDTFKTVMTAIGDILGAFGIKVRGVTSVGIWKAFGNGVGLVIGGIIKGVAILLNALAKVIGFLGKIIKWTGLAVRGVKGFGKGVGGFAAKAWKKTTGFIGGFFSGVKNPTVGLTAGDKKALGDSTPQQRANALKAMGLGGVMPTPPTGQAPTTTSSTGTGTTGTGAGGQTNVTLEVDGRKLGQILMTNMGNANKNNLLRTQVSGT